MSKTDKNSNVALPDVMKWFIGLKALVNKPTRHYGLESLLMILGISVLISTTVFMFNAIFDYIFVENISSVNFSYDSTLSALVVVIIVLPLTFGLYKRVRIRENNQPDVTDNRWRRVFLNIFLFGLFAAFVFILFSLIKTTITELTALEVGATSDSPLWHRIIRFGFSLFLIAGLFKYFTVHTSERPTKSDKKFIYFSSTFIVMLTIGLIAFPLRAQRGVYIDGFVEKDMITISNKINAHFANRGQLPEGLDDLDLDSDIDNRRRTLEYDYRRKSSARYSGGAYELCAEFRTDTSNLSTPGEPYYGSSSNPSIHRAGWHCFDFSTTTYSPYFLNDEFDGIPSSVEESIFEGFETLTR